jgi:hypothetical protein
VGSLARRALALGLIGCGSSGAARKDGGAHAREPVAVADDEPDAALAVAPIAAAPVAVTVHVTWPDAPAAVRAAGPPGPCGVPGRARAIVGTLFGVTGAVVFVDGAPGTDASADAAPAELIVGDCRIAPTVAIARPRADLAIASADLRRHRVTLAAAGALADVGRWAAPVARGDFALPWAGAELAIGAGAPGVIRAATAASPDEPSWIVVTDGAAAITDRDGAASLRLPPGHWRIAAWLPAVDGRGPLVASTELDVAAGAAAEATIALGAP